MTPHIPLLCSTGAMSRNPDHTSYQQVLRYGPQVDADGLELMFYKSWYPEIEHIANELQASQLHIPAMHAEKDIGVLLGSTSIEDRQHSVSLLAENCRLGSMIGVQIIILHLWGWSQLDDHLDYNLEQLHHCIDAATHYGIKLAIETIPARHADPLTNVQRAFQQDQRSYIALDTEFLALYDQNDAVFTTPWLWEHERVQHIHIKDFDGQSFKDGKRRYLHPGEGNIDFVRFFTQLKQHHYTGYVSLESPAIDNSGYVDIARLQQSLNFVRALL